MLLARRPSPETVGRFLRASQELSVNGGRVLYCVGSGSGDRFGLAYGTLTNHAESGEERFEVFLDPENGEVKYRIRATSKPQAALAWLGQVPHHNWPELARRLDPYFAQAGLRPLRLFF